jgi:uncharacterized FlaG/YvyC family protein
MPNSIDPVNSGALTGLVSVSGSKSRDDSDSDRLEASFNSTRSQTSGGVAAAVSKDSLGIAVSEVQKIVSAVTDNNVSFSVEEDLNRMVVSVRVVGSDEIVRQFPPEEFLTVAKFLAEQDMSMVDEDFLKGILFDQYS